MFFEKRASRRAKLKGLLPGRLLVENAEDDLVCRLVDVNTQGIGVLSEETIEVGTKITLKVKEGDVHLVVAWGQRDFGKRDMFRYGLQAVDASLDMEELFRRHDCLD